jgi:iron transport multicopper oxidase
MFQNGTNYMYMDGVPMLTQCEIPIGGSVTYNFTVRRIRITNTIPHLQYCPLTERANTTEQLNQTGSYWYHFHTRGQYPEGFRGALITQDPENPYLGQYDEERVIMLSDWYHDHFRNLLKSFIDYKNPRGAEPVPNAALINETSDFTMDVEAGKTYLLRFINIEAFASMYLWLEGHTMQIVEVDGVWTEPAEASMIYISAAQRYTMLVTMNDDTTANYPLVASMDTVSINCGDWPSSSL